MCRSIYSKNTLSFMNIMFPISQHCRVIAPIILLATTVLGDPVWYNSSGAYIIENNNINDNIYIVNGTRVYLENGTITALGSTDDGNHAILVEDSTFYGKNGTIYGNGGKGISISTTRGTVDAPGTATFEAGVEAHRGDAFRKKKASGGIAVQVLHNGYITTFNGGKFVAGMGCRNDACGTANENGVAIHVVQGKVILKGGTFEGGSYNDRGTIEVHGCVCESIIIVVGLHLYLPPTSCHTPGLTVGLIHGHFYRLFMLCSHGKDIELKIYNFFNPLLNRGYSLPTLVPLFLNAERQARSRRAQQLLLQSKKQPSH